MPFIIISLIPADSNVSGENTLISVVLYSLGIHINSTLLKNLKIQKQHRNFRNPASE